MLNIVDIDRKMSVTSLRSTVPLCWITLRKSRRKDNYGQILRNIQVLYIVYKFTLMLIINWCTWLRYYVPNWNSSKFRERNQADNRHVRNAMYNEENKKWAKRLCSRCDILTIDFRVFVRNVELPCLKNLNR